MLYYNLKEVREILVRELKYKLSMNTLQKYKKMGWLVSDNMTHDSWLNRDRPMFSTKAIEIFIALYKAKLATGETYQIKKHKVLDRDNIYVTL